ncbi:transposase [Synergistales bacterium]|nr:transposase [Synergistales bacterium]
MTPRLLPLKSDIIFKLVFGDARYTEIIRAFLVATLDIPGEEYEELKIIDPHLERDSPDDKLGILDVRVQLKNKKLISVEIQVRDIPFMAERVAFSTGRNLSRRIAPGQDYSQITKAVTIVITNCDIIADGTYYHHKFWLYDPEHNVGFTDIMEVHTLELKKLPEVAADNPKENELLDWLRLIRSDREEEIKLLATKTPEMKMAVSRLVQLSADERTRMLYEAREMYAMDEMVRIKGAHAKGKAEGKAEGKSETAINLLRMNIDKDTVSKATGLSLDEIQGLSNYDS